MYRYNIAQIGNWVRIYNLYIIQQMERNYLSREYLSGARGTLRRKSVKCKIY